MFWQVSVSHFDQINFKLKTSRPLKSYLQQYETWKTDIGPDLYRNTKNHSVFLFVPDKTVYDIDRGSYFVPYNSFKQTRTPVSLMYYKRQLTVVSVVS